MSYTFENKSLERVRTGSIREFARQKGIDASNLHKTLEGRGRKWVNGWRLVKIDGVVVPKSILNQCSHVVVPKPTI